MGNKIDFDSFKKGSVISSYYRVANKWDRRLPFDYSLIGAKKGFRYITEHRESGFRKNTYSVKSKSPLHYVVFENGERKVKPFAYFIKAIKPLLAKDEIAVFVQDFCEEDGNCHYRLITVLNHKKMKKKLLTEKTLSRTDHIIMELKLSLALEYQQDQQDEELKELLLAWNKETDPDLKEQKSKAVEERWAKINKELARLEEQEELEREEEEKKRKEEYDKRYEEERKKRKEEERRQLIEDWKEHPQWEKYREKLPIYHILYCNYPGLEFKEEIETRIDASNIEKDDGWYDWDDWDELEDWEIINEEIDNVLGDQGIEKLLDAHYTEDDVDPQLNFEYDELLMGITEELPYNDNVKIFLDSINKDGKVIKTREIDIMDFFDRHPDCFQETGMFDATNEYIIASQNKYLKRSRWRFALKNDDYELEDPKDWPAPKDNGTWVDENGNKLQPCIWFDVEGEGFTNPWIVNEENMDFWLSGGYGGYFVEYSYDGLAGCYHGAVPVLKEACENCPIVLEAEDIQENIDEKIQAFFIEQYKKAHS